MLAGLLHWLALLIWAASSCHFFTSSRWVASAFVCSSQRNVISRASNASLAVTGGLVATSSSPRTNHFLVWGTAILLAYKIVAHVMRSCCPVEGEACPYLRRPDKGGLSVPYQISLTLSSAFMIVLLIVLVTYTTQYSASTGITDEYKN